MYTENEYIILSLIKQKIFLIFIFLVLSPLTLLSSFLALYSVNKSIKLSQTKPSYIVNAKSAQVYAPINDSNLSITSAIVYEDARPKLLEEYLSLNNSPLKDYSKYLVKTADTNGLDWRLLTAISMKESGACKVIPMGSFNCWGWGIHSKGTLMFDSYEEAIDTVSKGLKENYIDKGYVTIEEIMKKYAHPDSTTWAEGVLYYVDRISNVYN